MNIQHYKYVHTHTHTIYVHTCKYMYTHTHTCTHIRYLVDVRWMKQWKRYVGDDQEDQSQVGLDSANPGPIDNSNLFKGGSEIIITF